MRFSLLGIQFSLFERIPPDATSSEEEAAEQVSIIEDRDKEPRKVVTKVKSKALQYNTTRTGDVFQEPDYDLNSIAAALDTESYYRVAVDKVMGRIMKRGFAFVGQDSAAVQYIYKRFSQMAMVTGTPLRDLIEDIGEQLVVYSNAFIMKTRNIKASGGGLRQTFDRRTLQPVAAYEVLDATSIRIARKTSGIVKHYKQEVPGAAEPPPQWKPEDMVHMHYRRKRGLAFGTPTVLPALDDIRALRNMEQNIEILVFQYSVPMYHTKVGTDAYPAKPTDIDDVKASLNQMPQNGLLITAHTTEVTVVGAEGEAIKAGEYLEYFKKRVLAGLRLGAVSVGEGDTANRSTAGVIDGIVQETAEVFQARIKMFFDELIIKEILAEGGYDTESLGDGKPLVGLFFPPIDIEEKIAYENHIITLFTSDLLSHNEARNEIGRDPMVEDEWNDTYWNLIKKPLALIGAVDEPFLGSGGELKGGGSGKGDTIKKAAARGGIPAKALQKGQPENQHGRRSAPKTNKDAMEDDVSEDTPAEVIALLAEVGYWPAMEALNVHYNSLRYDLLLRIQDPSDRGKSLAGGIIELAAGSMIKSAQHFATRAFMVGADAVDPGKSEVTEEAAMLDIVKKQASSDILRFSKDLTKAAVPAVLAEDEEALESAFSSIGYRLDFISRYVAQMGWNYGYAVSAKTLGLKKLGIAVHDDPDGQCNKHPHEVDLEDLEIWRIPPFHANCGCTLKR